MQGSISFLLDAVCALIVDVDLKDLVHDVLGFLLRFQFVESSTGGGVRQVCEGSSMGLPHSGLVAVLAFVYSQDLNGARIARRPFRSKHGVLMYIRYVDNLLFVCDGHCVVADIVHDLAELGPYPTKLEETGSEGVDFLDFRVIKTVRFLASGMLTFIRSSERKARCCRCTVLTIILCALIGPSLTFEGCISDLPQLSSSRWRNALS